MEKEWLTTISALFSSINKRKNTINAREFYELAVKWHKEEIVKQEEMEEEEKENLEIIEEAD